MSGGGKRSAPETSIVSYELADLLHMIAEAAWMRPGTDGAFSYGKDVWDALRPDAVGLLGVDLGECPDGTHELKAIAKGASMLSSWLALLRTTNAIVGGADTRSCIPLDRRLLPVELDERLRSFWHERTVTRLSLTDWQVRSVMEAFADVLGGSVPNVGDMLHLPHNLALIRLGSLHLVRREET